VLEYVLSQYSGPQVLDADALNLVADGLQPGDCAERIWTPHPGEFKRLTGILPSGDDERLKETERFATERGGTILLKGNRTVVHDGDRFYVNLTGNAGMATAGSGDVLTGLITALLGQGVERFESAQLGAWLHGFAGDIAAESLGQPSLTATDLINYLPEAFRRTLEER
jgi:NAD(P)H-hydrate epimerase